MLILFLEFKNILDLVFATHYLI